MSQLCVVHPSLARLCCCTALKVAAYIRAEHADIHAEYAAGKVTSFRWA